MENIMDLTSVAFRGETLDRLSAQLHESRAATKRGVENAMPVALAGLAEHARSEQNAEELLRTIQSGQYPHVESEAVQRATSDAVETNQIARAGTGFMNRIFGERLSRLVDAVSGPSGLSRSSATTVLGLALPLVLHEVGKEATTRNLDAFGLSRLLAREEQRISPLLPASFASAFSDTPIAGRRSVAPSVPERRKPGLGWLWLVLAILAGLLLLFVALRGAKSPMSAPNLDVRRPEVAAPGVDRPEMVAKEEPAVSAAPLEKPPAPALTMLSGSGQRLGDFLAGSDPTPQRFAVEGLQFPIGSSAIGSNATLDGVAKALAQHPSAKIRVEGHTDFQGSGADNQTLSERRAKSVKRYLVGKGVAAERIETAGYSENSPLAPNATSEGRAENRRIEIIVTQR
jgi:OmpA-OmpF porin, OOP family